MKIVGCDLHTRYQQIAMLDQETGELIERRLEHESGEARAFYAGLSGPVRVGVEATGHTSWFERMLAELGHQLWGIGTDGTLPHQNRGKRFVCPQVVPVYAQSGNRSFAPAFWIQTGGRIQRNGRKLGK